LEKFAPFLLDNRLNERGGIYGKAAALVEPYIQVDGLVATGQNPASSTPVAEALLKLMRESAKG
jgi:putative intracellular protease/amidase